MHRCAACLTFEVGRKSFVVGNADQSFNADFLEHELTLGEELASEALEQVGFDLLASVPETCEFLRGQVCGDAKHELRREAKEVGGVRHDVVVVSKWLMAERKEKVSVVAS